MTKMLQTKASHGWTNDDGTVIPPHTLYRFVDANGRGGCWYAKLENAERSWARSHPVGLVPAPVEWDFEWDFPLA